MYKIQQYHKSVAEARREISRRAKDQFSEWAKTLYDETIVSIKLSKTGPYGGKNEYVNGRRLYDITLRKKQRIARKGHPFRGVKRRAK